MQTHELILNLKHKTLNLYMAKYSFFNRDISWLSFNERVLKEAS
ncbi:MAG: hypothetical protein ICV65_20235, partial [Flavisolibacter sp.]|nr:hypothetical protein [Flavisolibacter sp.]